MKSYLRLLALLWFGMLFLAARTPARSAEEPFAFIQLSDPQLGMFSKNVDFEQETANFEFAVATVNRLRPAFVIITGDLVNKPGDAAQIAEYKRITGRVRPGIPVYHVAGNHDVGNTPTPETVAAWTKDFGPDHYAFRHRGLVGLVLNSNFIYAPLQARQLYDAQEKWLRAELKKAREEGAAHAVVFQHHPWFIKLADEPDQYFNIPRDRRDAFLTLFQEYGVKYLFSGHYHRNALATKDGIEFVTTGPVGKPLGDGKSGLRIVTVYPERIEHRYYHFGELPERIEFSAGKEKSSAAPTQK